MRASAVLLALALTGCASDGSGSPPGPSGMLQMQDLAVMLPLAHSQAELDAQLSASSPGRGGVLLPQSALAGDGAAFQYSSLRVVAFRFDPCFGATDPASSQCQNQLRLVFQPTTLESDGAMAQDAAIHASYALGRDELLAAVAEMVDARVHAAGNDDDLGPLAPHPIIAREGLTGPLAAAFFRIIEKYAGQANLVAFTSLNAGVFSGSGPIPNNMQFWDFQRFDVSAGHPSASSIPGLPDGTMQLDLDTTVMPMTASVSVATTSSDDDITVLANFPQASQAPAAALQAGFDAALRIENPHQHTPLTIDCASCHVAEPARTLVGDALGMHEAGNPNRFTADPAIPAADVVTTTSVLVDGAALNIHAFSYLFNSPMINQRVVNDTAADVAAIAPLLGS